MGPRLRATDAPDFELVDTEGQTVRFSDFRGVKHVLLVFNRGFFWPFCRRHMAQLRRDYDQFLERDAEVVAVGPEDYDSFREWWKEHEMPFIGLADPDHAVADLYGQETHLVKGGRMPAQFLIDKHGQVRYQHYGSSMADIPPNAEMLRLLGALSDEENV